MANSIRCTPPTRKYLEYFSHSLNINSSQIWYMRIGERTYVDARDEYVSVHHRYWSLFIGDFLLVERQWTVLSFFRSTMLRAGLIRFKNRVPHGFQFFFEFFVHIAVINIGMFSLGTHKFHSLETLCNVM